MTMSMWLRTGVQVVVFLLVARILGVENYGAYAAVLALSAAVGCFSGLGTQSIVVRELSRSPDSLAAVWGKAIAALVVTSPVLLLLYIAVSRVVIPVDIAVAVVLFIGIAEIFFAPFVLATICLYQGQDRIRRASQLLFLPVLPRLISAFLLLALSYFGLSTDLLLILSFVSNVAD